MYKAQYRRCAFDGIYHHPDEVIRVPLDAPTKQQKTLCLDHAEQFLKHLISLAECKTIPIGRRRAA